MTAIELMAGAEFGTSAQVLQEFYWTVTRKGPHRLSPAKALEWVEQIAVQPCVPIDASLVKITVGLSERYRIPYWDGAIIAAAESLGTNLVYSEDLSDGQLYGTVRVVNPFARVPPRSGFHEEPHRRA